MSLEHSYLTDPNLSLKARGLLSVVFSFQDDFVFSIRTILSATKERETAIYSAIRELIDNGYCKKEGKLYSFYKEPIK